MGLWSDPMLWALSLVAGGAVMVLHGVLLRCRLRCAQSLGECVPPAALWLVAVAGAFALLLFSQGKTASSELLGPLALLTATAPALLAWLGPPEDHVERSRLCRIGRGSAYSHYYGYLRLMNGDHEARERLEAFRRAEPPEMSDKLDQFFSDAVMVLAPVDGKYPDKSLSALRDNELPGVGRKTCCVPKFQSAVGGNERTYGEFSVHKVTSKDGRRSRIVALDKVDALGTLRKLREHGPAGLKTTDCQKQMEDMIDELKKIVAERDHLRDQVKFVCYQPGQHVGDAILAAIDDASPEVDM